MTGMIEIAQQNLLSPMVLFFALGLFASFRAGQTSTFPEAIAKTMAIYLMMAIGFKGGVELAKAGASVTLFLVLGAGALVSAVLPLIGFALLSATSSAVPHRPGGGCGTLRLDLHRHVRCSHPGGCRRRARL
jgi:hypothetical protein